MEFHIKNENNRKLAQMSSNVFGKLSKSEVMKRKKIKQPTDKDTYFGVEEPALIRKKLKPTKMTKQNGNGRLKQLARPLADCRSMNVSSSNHESPKVWDIFERYKNFSKRKLLTRTSSGLLDSCDESVEKKSNVNNEKIASKKSNIAKDNASNRRSDITAPNAITEKLLDKQTEPLTGGNRKRKLAEIVDYDEGQPDGKRMAQPVSYFKPKCLNFYEIDDWSYDNRVDDKHNLNDTNNFERTEF